MDHKLSKIIEEVVSESEDELRNTCRKCRVTSVGFGGPLCAAGGRSHCSGQQERAAAS